MPEKVHTHRKVGGTWTVIVKWVGWATCASTREPIENVNDNPAFHKYVFGRTVGASQLKDFCRCDECTDEA